MLQQFPKLSFGYMLEPKITPEKLGRLLKYQRTYLCFSYLRLLQFIQILVLQLLSVCMQTMYLTCHVCTICHKTGLFLYCIAYNCILCILPVSVAFFILLVIWKRFCEFGLVAVNLVIFGYWSKLLLIYMVYKIYLKCKNPTLICRKNRIIFAISDT